MIKIRIIINPISGIGRQKKAERAIKNLLNKNLFDSEIMYSQRKGNLTLLAKEAAENNYDAVVVVGGDGSINEAAQGLIGTRTALGIIPIGSGNGLARHLKIPLSVELAVERINRYKTKYIDTAILNDYVFVSIAGIGFDAHIASQFRFAKKRGLWNYIKISVGEYFRFESKEYHLYLDDKAFKTDAFMIVFANANQFGNNMVISPEARIDDGFLDVCFIKKPKIYEIPDLLLKTLLKKAHKSKLVSIQRAKQINVEVISNTFLNLDGEAVLESESIHIAINPLSLSVII